MSSSSSFVGSEERCQHVKIIDNVNERLGDDLKAELLPGSKLRIAATTFSIFAFEALREELEAIDELEFIFTSPTFVTGEPGNA